MEIKNIFLHHTAVSRDKNSRQLVATNNYHRTKNWGTVASPAYCQKSSLGYFVQYHYFIEPSGELTQTALDKELRWHVGNYNTTSLGCCLTGNFDIERPTPEQAKQLRALLLELRKKYPEAKIRYHREVAPKSCPGKLIADDWAVSLLNPNFEYMYKLIGDEKTTKQYAQGEDGILHHISAALLEDLHQGKALDKHQVEWRNNLDGLTIGNSWAVIS